MQLTRRLAVAPEMASLEALRKRAVLVVLHAFRGSTDRRQWHAAENTSCGGWGHPLRAGRSCHPTSPNCQAPRVTVDCQQLCVLAPIKQVAQGPSKAMSSAVGTLVQEHSYRVRIRPPANHPPPLAYTHRVLQGRLAQGFHIGVRCPAHNPDNKTPEVTTIHSSVQRDLQPPQQHTPPERVHRETPLGRSRPVANLHRYPRRPACVTTFTGASIPRRQ